MSLIQKAEQFVFDLFKDKLSPAYTYHNFSHTQRVVRSAEKLIESESVTEDEQTALLLAAWFHDTGYVVGDQNHEESSVLLMRDFLKDEKIPESVSSIAESLILVTCLDKQPTNKLEFIMRDADCSHFSDKNYLLMSELLREEWKQTLGKTFTDIEWAVENRNVLSQKHRYFTRLAKEEWQEQKELNIALLQDKIRLAGEETVKKSEKKSEKDEKLSRGVETMFRITLNNHTRLSEIADSKANILLSVNAIIISISLSTLIPKLDTNRHLVLPTFILIVFSVVSIIFAILSTRPKVTEGSFTREDIEQRKVNLLFFGNFYKMPLEEYRWAMNEMIKDKEYLYDSMIKDLYYLGLVLNRKYTLLRTTYMIFMIGIIASVLAFAIAFQSIHV